MTMMITMIMFMTMMMMVMMIMRMMMGLKVTADQIEAVYDKLREKNDRITRYVLDVTKSA